MDIGIIVYSQTGHTLSVAEKLREKLLAAGHSANLEQVTVVGERKPGGREFQLEAKPSPGPYEALIFGSHVEAFSLCEVTTRYLKQTDSLEGKKVACLVTEAFPYPWMGGNRAIGQMKKLCRAKGASVVGSGVVNWPKSRREKTMARAIDHLSGLF